MSSFDLSVAFVESGSNAKFVQGLARMERKHRRLNADSTQNRGALPEFRQTSGRQAP